MASVGDKRNKESQVGTKIPKLTDPKAFWFKLEQG